MVLLRALPALRTILIGGLNWEWSLLLVNLSFMHIVEVQVPKLALRCKTIRGQSEESCTSFYVR